MKLLKIAVVTLLLLIKFNNTCAQTVTDLVHHELDKVDANAKIVVIAGKSYQYQLDVKNSSYRFEDDVKTSVPLSELKVGEKYYFQLMAKGNDMKSQNYRHVIFISKSRPSE